MDTSSPFASSRSPVALESVSLSQLLAHIKASDQREAFVREVVYNSPAPSVTSTFISRSSKRSGIIVNKKNSGFSSDSDSDNETAITCSSIGSVSRRTINGTAARKRSLCSAWFDEEDIDVGDLGSSDEDDPGPGDPRSSHNSVGVGDPGSSDEEDDVSTIARRAASRAGLAPSKRSLENLKNMSMFDAGFSFSRTCVTSPVKDVSPLESWFLCTPRFYKTNHEPT